MLVGRLTRVVDGLVLVATYCFIFDSRIWLGRDQRFGECLLALLLSQGLASAFRFSRSWRIIRIRYELAEILSFWSVVFPLLGMVFYLMGALPSQQASLWLPMLLRWYVVTLVASLVLRVLLRMSLRYFRAYGFDLRTAAFIGATDAAVRLAKTFRHHQWMGVRVLGFYDDRADKDRPPPDEIAEVAGSIADLVRLARDGLVSNIYITLPMKAEHRIRAIIEQFQDTTASIYFCPSLAAFDLIGARWDEVYGQPMISIVETPFQGFSRTLKQLEDTVLVLLALPVVLPVVLAIAPLVKLTSPGPIFYKQRRYGLDGKPFTMFKFRTMYVAEREDAFVQARRGDARITPLGRFLRRTSLDELPQFLNVLNGTMSVVGPRPHPTKLNEEFRRIVPRYMLRHKVKPGITGLAQINGARGETDSVDKMERRIEFDLAYLRSWSVGMDLRILLKTLLVPVFDRTAF